MVWVIRETLDAIESTFTASNQVRLCKESLSSVMTCINVLSYHVSEFKRVDKEFNDLHAEHALSPKVPVIANASSEVKEKFNEFEIAQIAHVHAAVAGIASIPDLVATLVYHCMGLNKTNNDELYHEQIANKLKQAGENSMQNRLLKLTKGDNFAYLRHIFNSAKHYNYTHGGTFINMDGSLPKCRNFMFRNISIEPLERPNRKNRKEKHFPSRPMEDVLESEMDRMINLVFEILEEITAVLQKKSE